MFFQRYLERALVKVTQRMTGKDVESRLVRRYRKIEENTNNYGKQLFANDWTTYKCSLRDAGNQSKLESIECGYFTSKGSVQCGHRSRRSGRKGVGGDIQRD